MNRYNIAHRCVGGLGVTEDQKGDWVLYDDVINLLGETKTLECNCEEESIKKAADRSRYPNMYHFWICPAHGYKRV